MGLGTIWAESLEHAPDVPGPRLSFVEALEIVVALAALVWEITALVSFFNFSARLQAASGLPPDQIPEGARFAEGRVG